MRIVALMLLMVVKESKKGSFESLKPFNKKPLIVIRTRFPEMIKKCLERLSGSLASKTSPQLRYP